MDGSERGAQRHDSVTGRAVVAELARAGRVESGDTALFAEILVDADIRGIARLCVDLKVPFTLAV